MNDHKIIDCQRRNIQAQQNHELTQDFDYEFDAINSSLQRQQPENNMGIWVQQQGIDHDQQSLSQLQSLVDQANNNKPSSTIISRFETPTLAFYAGERCMGFHHNFNANNNNCLSSHEFSTSPSSENYSINDSSEQPMFRPNITSPLFLSPVNTTINTPSITRQFSLNLKENNHQDIQGYPGSLGSSISQMSFGSSHHNQEKQSPRLVSGNGVSNSTTGNSALVSNSPAISSKTRIRWTQDLHEKFVECVNRLGGAEKATPKAILRLMESEGLTIFHVKSHLQKYRIAKYLPDSSEGKFEKRACIDVTPQLEATTSGLQIKEALQLQLDVQRRLHEQLEIQRNLQLQIEAQGKQLKMMFDMQQRTSNSLFKSQSSDISSPDDEPSNTIDDIQVSLAAEASGNTQFPPKIS